ncbi:threonine synthase [Campylobacter blaseri]|uniref:Threonine synthase n=1 Tax=Campylobacter blaseri TaxID=2042961 RepID=A0A2P8R260_9BACT|nr:threonine synthase [Campylobacter blaseri]PSM52572.1 threonine synthase [Campylobacter blaseri]PSM54220.1 threonine synthase [Campylobacter blaseri]QKF85871.1 threonine synthase [Campylobacter blaseri]
MELVGTRNANQKVDLSQALLNPSADFGGLFTPQNLPKFDKDFFKKAMKLSYSEFALEIIKSFNFDIENEVFLKALEKYKTFDDKTLPLKIEKIGENLYINELFHGPTRAFKDMALQPFSEIISNLAEKENKNYLIMCATSGDTGPATLQAFANKNNVKVVCLYPSKGTSEVQRLQMVNADAGNLKVLGIKGNFDDAQQALKTLLKDEDFKNSLKESNFYLSAANSVNFGRILFQIIYHFYAYIYLLKNGIIKDNESFDIVVPSGNFGNALGAYYAKKMGAKIDTIKIASNENNVLTHFFNDNVYDIKGKKLIQTMSPAMDILVSSNVERLLFHEFGDKKTKELMDNLEKNKEYKIEHIKGFEALYCTDKECSCFIKNMADKGKLIDPHTATCFKFKPNKPTIVTSTAHWVKFTPSMIKAIKDEKIYNEKEQMQLLASEFNDEIPSEILELFEKKAVHNDVVKKTDIKAKILEWIKL